MHVSRLIEIVGECADAIIRARAGGSRQRQHLVANSLSYMIRFVNELGTTVLHVLYRVVVGDLPSALHDQLRTGVRRGCRCIVLVECEVIRR